MSGGLGPKPRPARGDGGRGYLDVIRRLRAVSLPKVSAARPSASPGGRGRALDWLVAGVVLLVAGAVQVAFLLGPYPFDPAKYFKTAVSFPDVPPDLWTLRIGVVLPVRAAVLLFGPSEAALYAVPIAVGLALAAAVYGTMLLLFGSRSLAAGAALVVVLNPDWLLKSSSIFPDTIATATFTAGFFCLVAAARRADGREGGGPSPTMLATLAGVLFGWTYLARESSLILVPAVLAAVVLLRYPLRRVAILAGAAATTAGLELLYGVVQYGDARVHARVLLAERYRVRHTRLSVVEHIQGQLDSLLDTVVVFPRLLLAWRTGWLLLLLIAIFLVALVARFRDRRLWLLAAWGFSFWIILAALGLRTLPSGGWVVNVAIIRYWYPLFPPLVMGAFGAVALLVPSRLVLPGSISLVHAVAAILASLVLVPGLVEFQHCEAEHVWPNDSAAGWHQLRSWFATGKADQFDLLWTDEKTVRLLPAFTHSTVGHRLWAGSAKALPRGREAIVVPPARPRSLLLIMHGRQRAVLRATRRRRQWSAILVSDDRELILLAPAPVPVGEGPSSGEAWWRIRGSFRSDPTPGRCGFPYLRKGQP